jgi:outer membrane protein
MKKYLQKIIFLSIPALLLTGKMIAQTKSLTLQEALQMASTGNRQLQIQLLENKKAADAVKEAKSYLLPAVSGNATYNAYAERPVIYLRNETQSPKVSDVRFGGRFAFDSYVAASYPILSPSVKSNVRIAGISEQIQKRQTENTEEHLALDIALTYLAVLVNKEQANLLMQSLQRNERALKDSRSLFLQGKNLKTDTLSNYISVQNLKAGISALRNNTDVLLLQLKQLIGVEEHSHIELTDSLYITHGEMEIKNPDQFILSSLQNRNDIKIQSLLIDQSREQLQGTKALFKPQLSAIAQYQVQNQADNMKLGNYNFPRTSFAGLKLSIPVYSGGRQKHKLSQSKSTVMQNELALAEIENKVRTEIISLTTNLQEAYTQYRIQQQNVNAAEINYNMMNDRYRYGMGSRLELTDAELALTRSKMDFVQSIYSIRLSELQLKKAMGILKLN